MQDSLNEFDAELLEGILDDDGDLVWNEEFYANSVVSEQSEPQDSNQFNCYDATKDSGMHSISHDQIIHQSTEVMSTFPTGSPPATIFSPQAFHPATIPQDVTPTTIPQYGGGSLPAPSHEVVNTQLETLPFPIISLEEVQALFKHHEMGKPTTSAPMFAVACGPEPVATIPNIAPAIVPPEPVTNHVPKTSQSSVVGIREPAPQKGVQKGRKVEGQSQTDRRRERNRVLARKTRERKKAAFEDLLDMVSELHQQNQMLKSLVEMKIGGEHSQKILDDCDAMDKIPEGVLEACKIHSTQPMEDQDFDFVRSIQQSQHAFVITDPTLEDNPVVFASGDFLKLTGYSSGEVLGRNCRFLQGKDTSQEKVDKIRRALAKGDDVGVTLVNYTADGAPFWNKLFIAALRDVENNIVNYIGVSVKVASPAPEDPEFQKTLGNESE